MTIERHRTAQDSVWEISSQTLKRIVRHSWNRCSKGFKTHLTTWIEMSCWRQQRAWKDLFIVKVKIHRLQSICTIAMHSWELHNLCRLILSQIVFQRKMYRSILPTIIVSWCTLSKQWWSMKETFSIPNMTFCTETIAQRLLLLVVWFYQNSPLDCTEFGLKRNKSSIPFYQQSLIVDSREKLL